MSLPISIPDDEVDNVMSIYWQMLSQLESECDPKKDILDKHLIEGAYKVLNRVAKKTGSIHSDFKPRWMDIAPK
jgi:hypothetical protein